MHPDHIKQLILAGMTCDFLELDGDGQHFEAIVVSTEFSCRSAGRREGGVGDLPPSHPPHRPIRGRRRSYSPPESASVSAGAPAATNDVGPPAATNDAGAPAGANVRSRRTYGPDGPIRACRRTCMKTSARDRHEVARLASSASPATRKER